jgi:hypothetical protein
MYCPVACRYNVDVYFSGHVHAYQRTFPVYNNNVTTSYSSPPYPVHLIVGGAGCDEMDPPAQADLVRVVVSQAIRRCGSNW